MLTDRSTDPLPRACMWAYVAGIDWFTQLGEADEATIRPDSTPRPPVRQRGGGAVAWHAVPTAAAAPRTNRVLDGSTSGDRYSRLLVRPVGGVRQGWRCDGRIECRLPCRGEKELGRYGVIGGIR
jgi:hypothetical protein